MFVPAFKGGGSSTSIVEEEKGNISIHNYYIIAIEISEGSGCLRAQGVLRTVDSQIEHSTESIKNTLVAFVCPNNFFLSAFRLLY